MAITTRATGPQQHATGRLMQIGEVAERVGLSIRTIRHYEDAGLIVPSARSEGGFRLYTEPDLDRLAVVKRMKPLGFSLDEMRDLLSVLDALDTAIGNDRAELLDRLGMFHTAATTRVTALRDQLATAEGFADTLRDQLERFVADVDDQPASGVVPVGVPGGRLPGQVAGAGAGCGQAQRGQVGARSRGDGRAGQPAVA